MQRANIKGPPPAPPSLARPRNTHSSPPFFTTLPTLLLPLLPFLFFLRFCFFSVFSIFVRGVAFAQQTRGRERERGGKRERERNKAKTVYQGCKSKRECPQTAFIFSRPRVFPVVLRNPRRSLDHGRRTRDIITFNYRFCLDV